MKSKQHIAEPYYYDRGRWRKIPIHEGNLERETHNVYHVFIDGRSVQVPKSDTFYVSIKDSKIEFTTTKLAALQLRLGD